ncbi:MAG: cobalt-precorrin-5B (C(1))-methyltransferase [Bacteroidaceae bacterium]|nr:cobalt-precorrin-5B (C(1))-methyltransferase [Bacteroidaceae bacterium]
MILVLGGTTEGRKAVAELEEAGTPFYYSTKTGEQDMVLHHGIRVDGAMDETAMTLFCQRHAIQLLVDAAHPFAQVLHQTVALVAERLHLPAIRFERIFPPRDPSIHWLDGYADLQNNLPLGGQGFTLLATTGVQSIATLKPLEAEGVKVFYRILPRESSIRLAHQQGATDEQLCYYHEGEDERTILQELKPDAILLKESGETGGFTEKVEAAKVLGISVFAIKRPPTPAMFHRVNGEHGLRLMVEKLLPDFFPLHSGWTTGTCATAAAVAAATRLLKGETPGEVPVVLPNGETIMVPVQYGDGYASVVKQAGDDPDVTDGIEVRASVAPATRFDIKGGIGVGRFTLPGFDYPVGEPAINLSPRQMIVRNLQGFGTPFTVTLSVPQGEEIARKTFNPRLGITGGISIIGVSGIVKPFSEAAFIESIRKCMTVAMASGSPRIVVHSGAKSEAALRRMAPDLPPQAFVEYGNAIGETLKMVEELHHDKGWHGEVTLGIMLGKAVKLAEGHLDTHSKKVVMNKSFIISLLREASCPEDIIRKAESITLARELWQLIPAPHLEAFCHAVIQHCHRHCQPLMPHHPLTILLIDDEGHTHTTAH